MKQVQLNRKSMFVLSMITLFGLSAVGLAVVLWWQGRSLAQLFAGEPIFTQAVMGSGYGLTVGFLALAFVRTDFVRPIAKHFRNLFVGTGINMADALLVSLAAGVGEEVLFRGALQSQLNIWLTPWLHGAGQPHIAVWVVSLLFIAAHGYLSLKSFRLFVYGLFMVLMSAGLGYLYEYVGLVSAIVAHFAYDALMFVDMFYGKHYAPPDGDGGGRGAEMSAMS